VGNVARRQLFESPTVCFLLSRGKDATEQWSEETQFSEKQNDTADILVVRDTFFELLDVKTRNRSRKGQPPNIISSYKLAQLCGRMIDNADYDSFTMKYLGVEWEDQGETLRCVAVRDVELFPSDPSCLYINWSAALQVQFHVSDLEQNFAGSREQWARAYLKHFVDQARRRTESMITKFVVPFEKYLV
jgi:type II restriction enzyme